MLFNSFQFDSRLFNGGSSNVATFSTDLAVFDGFSLADGTYMVVTDLQDSEPSRSLISGEIPRADGMYLLADYYRQKDVTVKGYVKASTRALLDQYLDTIRKNLRGRQKYLDLTRASDGAVRRYVATLTNPDRLFAARQRYDITLCPFEAVFSCMTPFATDRGYTSASSQAITSSPTSITFDNAGTVHSYAVFALSFDSATSVTAIDIQHLDASGSILEEIQVSLTFATGDYVVIDGEQKQVTQNGTAKDYSGTFPLFEPGTNLYKFTITGSAFNAYTSIKALQSYL